MVKPFKYLYLHSVEPQMTWAEVDFDEFLSAKHYSNQFNIFVFDGSVARVHVITDDNNISRVEALKCASTFVFGHYKKMEVNLDTFDIKTTEGMDLTHPRQ